MTKDGVEETTELICREKWKSQRDSPQQQQRFNPSLASSDSESLKGQNTCSSADSKD